MQQEAINLRPRDFKLMVIGVCTRPTVTFILSISREVRKEQLVIPDLGEEGSLFLASLMLLAGIQATHEGLLGDLG